MAEFINPFTGEKVDLSTLVSQEKVEETKPRDWEKRFTLDEIEAELMQLNDYAIRHVNTGQGQGQIVNVINFFASTYKLEDDRDINLGHIDSSTKTIRLNMKNFMAMPKPERCSVFEHLKWHVVLLHESRANAFKEEKKRFELAADIAINNALKREGFVMPMGFPTNDKWTENTAEQIFRKLPPIPPEDDMNGLSSEIADIMRKDGEFDSSNSKDRAKLSASAQQTLQSLSKMRDELAKAGVDFGGGSYSDNPLNGDFSPIQEGLDEDILKSRVRGLLDQIGGIRAKLKEKDPNRNFSPFGVSDELMQLSEFLKPKIDWTAQLRNIIRTYIPQQKKTYARTNRRMATFTSSKLKFKGKKPKVGIPMICVGFDVSGSVSKDEIKRYLSEIHHLSLDNNVQEVQIASFNTGISQLFELDKKDIRNNEILALDIEIGGGTHPNDLIKYWNGEKDFSGEYFEKQCPFAIFFTDMEFDTGSLQLERNYPIIWVCVNNPNAYNNKYLPKGDHLILLDDRNVNFNS